MKSEKSKYTSLSICKSFYFAAIFNQWYVMTNVKGLFESSLRPSPPPVMTGGRGLPGRDKLGIRV